MGNDVLVVGLNPALDRTIILDKLDYAKTNTAKRIKDSAGGKSTNVAMALKNLDVVFTVTGMIAGENGAFIENTLASYGIMTEFLKLPGQTRINHKIFCEDTKTITEINDKGHLYDSKTANEVIEFVKKRITGKNIVVLCGSIPPGFPDDTYLKLIETAKKAEAKVILDTNAKLLARSIAAGPYAIKPNHEELEMFAGKKFFNEKEIGLIAKDTANRYGIDTVVVSLGKNGALGYRDQKAYHASGLKIIPVNTVGAGDSMVACLVYCMINEMVFTDTLAMMTAFSALTAKLDAGVFARHDAALRAKDDIIVREIFL